MFGTVDRDRGVRWSSVIVCGGWRWSYLGGNRFGYFPFSNVNATHSVSGTRREGGSLMNVKSNVLEQCSNKTRK